MLQIQPLQPQQKPRHGMNGVDSFGGVHSVRLFAVRLDFQQHPAFFGNVDLAHFTGYVGDNRVGAVDQFLFQKVIDADADADLLIRYRSENEFTIHKPLIFLQDQQRRKR